jgi:signal transduction histidine kinase
MLLVVYFVWNSQYRIQQGRDGPLYRNLGEYPAWIRHGFDPAELTEIPRENAGEWMRFEDAQFKIKDSPLTGLPKRSFLSPWGKKTQEFTIIMPLEMDGAAISFLNDTQGAVQVVPGIFLAIIGENWEVYFNGTPVRSEMHLDETGQIRERRTWRNVYFPLDKSLIKQGTNILAFRILGDPAYDGTGLYYAAPYYLDDYKIIEARQRNFLPMILVGVFGFIGIYYLMLFISVRNKKELFNLYFSIFSILLSVYACTRYGIAQYLIPNSDICFRLEYASLFSMVPMLCCFIEELSRRRVTKISKICTAVCLFFSATQFFFCNQYGEEILKIWNLSIIVYFSYILFYNIFYFYFRHRREYKDNYIFNILIGSVFVYACAISDTLDVLVFHNSINLFTYSIFVYHIGMVFTLSLRYSGMYKQLEQSNVTLETAVRERTLELEEQTRIAINASRAKSEFLANMSHEIRTPMNSIVGFSELALDADIAPKTKEYLSRIKDNTLGLLRIINDILDISKVESSKLILEQTPFDLRDIFSQCESIISPSTAEKGLALHICVDPAINKKLLGDPIRLRQVLLNLLSNAVKFTDAGTVKVSASVKYLSEKACAIYFEITYSGIGMRLDQMGRIFEPFVQADTGITRKYGGTGLGLSIAKSLVELMGGVLEAESTPGQGSKFSFELSFDTADSSAVTDNTVTGDEIAKPLFNGEILVCEDNPMNQQVIIDHLANVGIKTVLAHNGREAVDITERRLKNGEKPFDLIFMDIHMPVMDGIEAASKITKLRTGTPIVAMTANIMSQDRELYRMNGMTDCMEKRSHPGSCGRYFCNTLSRLNWK